MSSPMEFWVNPWLVTAALLPNSSLLMHLEAADIGPSPQVPEVSVGNTDLFVPPDFILAHTQLLQPFWASISVCKIARSISLSLALTLALSLLFLFLSLLLQTLFF